MTDDPTQEWPDPAPERPWGRAERTAISRSNLLRSISSATGQSEAAVSAVLDALFSTVAEAVTQGSKVSIPGWISFETVATSARSGRNPQTGQEIRIPAGKRVKVTAGSKLKAAVK